MGRFLWEFEDLIRKIRSRRERYLSRKSSFLVFSGNKLSLIHLKHLLICLMGMNLHRTILSRIFALLLGAMAVGTFVFPTPIPGAVAETACGCCEEGSSSVGSCCLGGDSCCPPGSCILFYPSTSLAPILAIGFQPNVLALLVSNGFEDPFYRVHGRNARPPSPPPRS